MNNWMKMVSCNDSDFEGLHDELRNCGGLYIFDNVKMPESCNNAECTIEFRYYGEDKISLTCVQAPVPYTGNDGNIALWMENGIVEFESFEEMKGFLRCFKHDLPDNANITPAPVVTNTPVMTNENPSRNEAIPAQPEMVYDRDSLTVPTENKYIKLDRNKLIIDLNKEFFGMKENILKIAHLVCNHIGTKGKDKPLTIFLYGPPGTGKSDIVKEMVEAINSQLDKKHHFKYKDFDCSQCLQSEDVNKIIGAPPGYIGHDEPGLFSILEETPNAVFVFEEIDRATKSVSEVIMQAMENGRQATNGRRLKNGDDYYDLSHSIIFFTSNIKLDETPKSIGFATSDRATTSAVCVETSLPKSPAEIARLISRESTVAREKLLDSGKFDAAVISRMNAVFKFNKPSDDAIIDIAAKSIRKLALNRHKLHVTRLETPVLQQFLNVTVSGSETFNPRVLREEARNYFDFAFGEYAHTHEDYAPIIVSGSLEDVIVSPFESK